MLQPTLEVHMELSETDFEAVLASATTPADISKYFTDDCHWEFNSYEEQDAAIIRAADRAIELVSSISEGIELFRAFGAADGVITREQDTRLFDKLLDISTTETELTRVFDNFVPGSMSVGEQLHIRRHLRKIFDKADELGVEVKVTIT